MCNEGRYRERYIDYTIKHHIVKKIDGVFLGYCIPDVGDEAKDFRTQIILAAGYKTRSQVDTWH